MIVPAEVVDCLFSAEGENLRKDVVVWSNHYKSSIKNYCDINSISSCLEQLFRSYPEFRSLFDYRVRRIDRIENKNIAPQFHRRVNLNLNLRELGGGAFIQHGSSTWIFAKSIGENFFINQNVTIGQGKGGAPKIGNNVSIRTGAVVVGDICIGNNVVINANAVVNFDVPDNAKVYAQKSVVII